MAFNTVGIQDNLPVQPVHVLQIIQALSFSGAYAAESIYRQGRTNFGASAFASSAHVEMHSYGGADPLVVYGGPADDVEVLKVAPTGVIITALTASGASATTASLGRTTIDTAIIAAETVTTSTISSATIAGATIQNGVITTLNGTVGAIATFTASNAQVTNTATIATANVTNLTATNANLTGSLLGSATSASYALSASYAVSASQAGSALTASFVTASNVVGTVTSASYAITASYALNSANATPGGGNLAVQLNNANAGFTGSQNLVWDTANTFLVNKGYYVLDYANNSGAGLVARAGTPATNSFQISFNNQARYGGSVDAFSGRQISIYDFQAGGVTAYRAGMNESGDFFIGNSNTDFSAKFQQPTQSTNIPLTLKGASGQTADIFKVTNNNDTAVLFVSASGVTSGSFQGNLTGTASFAPIVAGPGIAVNGMAITASVRTVNGIIPTNGNIAVSLAGVITGTSASLVSSGSGAVTASISNGALWVISGDATPANNGDAYIFNSGSVGQWLPVAPLDTAAGDARYLMLNGGNAATQDLNFGGFDAISAGTWFGTASIASFVTASNVSGPYGASSVVSSSYAVSASYFIGSTTVFPYVGSATISGSLLVSGSGITVTGSLNAPSITGSLQGTASLAITASHALTASSVATLNQNVNVVGTLTTTGSLRVTGSGITVAGSLTATKRIAVDVYGAGGIQATALYPSWPTVDFSISTNKACFAYISPAATGQASQGGGGITYYFDDINIGPYTAAGNAGSIKIATDQGATSPTATKTYTLVSHGNNVTDSDTNWKTANGREHALTVSGSMLARDGVSLGTNIANSHIITGSVNMTGSFTLNGANLATLVSPVQSVTVDLTQNQILQLGVTPVELVPQPGIGKYIAVVQIALYYNYVSQAYTGGTTVRIQTGTTLLNSTDLLANTDDRIAISPGSTSTGIGSNGSFASSAASLLNAPVRILTTDVAGNSQNPSGGFGTMRVRVLYTIEDALQ